MTTPAGGALSTDFELMTAVAGKTDARNEEIRAMLQSFIGRMGGVPPSVWGGVAAARFGKHLGERRPPQLRIAPRGEELGKERAGHRCGDCHRL